MKIVLKMQTGDIPDKTRSWMPYIHSEDILKWAASCAISAQNRPFSAKSTAGPSCPEHISPHFPIFQSLHEARGSHLLPCAEEWWPWRGRGCAKLAHVFWNPFPWRPSSWQLVYFTRLRIFKHIRDCCTPLQPNVLLVFFTASVTFVVPRDGSYSRNLFRYFVPAAYLFCNIRSLISPPFSPRFTIHWKQWKVLLPHIVWLIGSFFRLAYYCS